MLGMLTDEQTHDFPIEQIEESNTLVRQRQELEEKIAKGHDYKFVGRVGLFCPVLPGKGGGLLMRKGTDGRYTSVAGSKGYRWLESGTVQDLHYENNLDMGYFNDLASLAVETIEKFGPYDAFVEDIPFDGPYKTLKEEKGEIKL